MSSVTCADAAGAPQTAAATTNRAMCIEDGITLSLLTFVFRNLDTAFPQALVIFLARVLHDLPIGAQRERPRVVPLLGERLGIVHDHFVRDVPEVRARETLNEVQLIAVRVADRVEPRLVVEVDRVDDERVAFPMADRIAEPRRDAVSVRTAVDRNHREPRVLLEEEREVLVALHDLHRLGRIDGPRHAEWQAGAGVIAFGRVVRFPFGFAPRGEWKLRVAFLILAVLRHVRRVRLLPHTAEIDFAGRGSRRRAGGRLILAAGAGGLPRRGGRAHPRERERGDERRGGMYLHMMAPLMAVAAASHLTSRRTRCGRRAASPAAHCTSSIHPSPARRRSSPDRRPSASPSSIRCASACWGVRLRTATVVRPRRSSRRGTPRCEGWPIRFA